MFYLFVQFDHQSQVVSGTQLNFGTTHLKECGPKFTYKLAISTLEENPI
jgi:hypothetical protein